MSIIESILKEARGKERKGGNIFPSELPKKTGVVSKTLFEEMYVDPIPTGSFEMTRKAKKNISRERRGYQRAIDTPIDYKTPVPSRGADQLGKLQKDWGKAIKARDFGKAKSLAKTTYPRYLEAVTEGGGIGPAWSAPNFKGLERPPVRVAQSVLRGKSKSQLAKNLSAAGVNRVITNAEVQSVAIHELHHQKQMKNIFKGKQPGTTSLREALTSMRGARKFMSKRIPAEAEARLREHESLARSMGPKEYIRQVRKAGGKGKKWRPFKEMALGMHKGTYTPRTMAAMEADPKMQAWAKKTRRPVIERTLRTVAALTAGDPDNLKGIPVRKDVRVKARKAMRVERKVHEAAALGKTKIQEAAKRLSHLFASKGRRA